LREKGTNRAAYFRGEIDRYGWKSLGSSYLLSDILAAKLLSQLEDLDQITQRRKKIWQHYFDSLKALEVEGNISLPIVPEYANHNGHMFYLVCKNKKDRTDLLTHLRNNKIQSTFHFLSLHKSEFFNKKYEGDNLSNSDRFTNCLLRLPLYPLLRNDDQDFIIEKINKFF